MPLIATAMTANANVDDWERTSRPRGNDVNTKTSSFKGAASTTKPLSIVSSLIADCLCNGGNYHRGNFDATNDMSRQFLELKGIRFIALGAVADELTPRQRIDDTLEVFRTKTERLVSIGYVSECANDARLDDSLGAFERTVETVPLTSWGPDLPDSLMSSGVKLQVDLVLRKDFARLADNLRKQLQLQKSHPASGDNFYQSGITAHNLGVVMVFMGDDDEAERLFREAKNLKEVAFGSNHGQVALSWDEIGNQRFACSDFDGAAVAFREAHRLRKNANASKVPHPILAMTLNNIACCEFQEHKYSQALCTLEEARSIQHKALGSAVQDDLDLLHVAIVYGNCGYLRLALKQYDEARSILEEALLIQQSVLDDSHRAVRDTLSNIEFANAFHS